MKVDENNKFCADDYFMGASDEMAEYMADQGIKAHERQELAAATIRDRAYKLLNLLIAGSGGSIMLFLNSEKNMLSFALLILCAGWSSCAVLISTKCLFVTQRIGLYGSPEMLYYDWDSVYGDDLEAIQKLKRVRLAVYERANNSIAKFCMEIGTGLNRAITYSIATTAITAIYIACYFFFFRPSGM